MPARPTQAELGSGPDAPQKESPGLGVVVCGTLLGSKARGQARTSKDGPGLSAPTTLLPGAPGVSMTGMASFSTHAAAASSLPPSHLSCAPICGRAGSPPLPPQTAWGSHRGRSRWAGRASPSCLVGGLVGLLQGEAFGDGEVTLEHKFDGS